MTRNCTLQGGAAVVCHEGDASSTSDGMSTGSIIGLVVLGLAVVGGGAYYVYNTKKKARP